MQTHAMPLRLWWAALLLLLLLLSPPATGRNKGSRGSKRAARPQPVPQPVPRPAPYDPSVFDAACAATMEGPSLSAPSADGDGAFLGAVLGRVPGLSRSRFFAEHWNRKPLWVRSRGPRQPATLLSLAEIDAVIAAHPEEMRNGRGLKFAMEGQIVGQHLGDGTVIDVAAAHEGFGRGATVIIHEIERLHPRIGAVALALERELGVFASANMYLTPPIKRAFDPHFDLEDTFIQQVSGSKTWRVWSPPTWPVPLPLRAQTEGKNSAPPTAATCFTLTLEPGDVLYVPRGHSHVAVPATASGNGEQPGPPSVHLTNTLHVQEFTWVTLLRLVVATGDEKSYARPEHREAGVSLLQTFYRQSVEAMSKAALHEGMLALQSSALPGLKAGVGSKTGGAAAVTPEEAELGASLREPYDIARCGEALTIEIVLLAGLYRVALAHQEFREVVSPFWPSSSAADERAERSGTSDELEAEFTARVAIWVDRLQPDDAAVAAGCVGAGRKATDSAERALAVLRKATQAVRWGDVAATARALYAPSFQQVASAGD